MLTDPEIGPSWSRIIYDSDLKSMKEPWRKAVPSINPDMDPWEDAPVYVGEWNLSAIRTVLYLSRAMMLTSNTSKGLKIPVSIAVVNIHWSEPATACHDSTTYQTYF